MRPNRVRIKMTIYFTADTHFDHEGILLHQPARLDAFGCLEEMNTHLIDAINAVVKRDDTLWHLGDFCWRASRAGHFRQRLNVRKLFVCQGNHDSGSLRKHVSGMWDMSCQKFSVRDEIFKIHMCHYPLLSWRALHHGALHLYGHSHGMYEDLLDEMFPGRRAMDIGVDAIYRLIGEWRPISLDEVIERLVKENENEQ